MARSRFAAMALAGAVCGAAVGAVSAALVAIDGPATVGTTAQRVPRPAEAGTSLRLFGTGAGDVDRVKIPLSATTAVNVGSGDFTIEFWIRGDVAANPATGCSAADAGWINGHIVVDRDVYGPGDRGDFGISLLGGRVAWGVSRGASGATVCGATNVLDGAWHHVAVTRVAASGALAVWVDGRLDGALSASPATGDVSYRVGRATDWPASDPFLVLGAEKHDAGPAYPSFDGWIDDVRVSTAIRYTGPFTPPTAPFAVDPATAALYGFDEPDGIVVVDAAGRSPGELRVGGPSSGPVRSPEVPFGV